ncbi:MAG: ATP synthase F0 subunit B [Spirochaetes bacterium GWF1_41_5]|nr:MAG: ATP synthase F0 subunit B [Spirochaetes bacterium GWF1_41_5]HBE03472.1 ATP synthase F0 subunit B [Spirochaetia bacterium]
MNLFAIDPGLAIWTWIVFGLLFLILWKFALPPLLKSLKEREAVIAGSVDSALQIEKRLSDINTEREEIIRLTKNEADSLLHSARADAETLRTNLLSQAEQEAREIASRAEKKTSARRLALFDEMRLELSDLVCITAEKLVKRSYNGAADKKWTRGQINLL